MRDTLLPKANVVAQVHDVETGQILQTIHSKNLVVTAGRNLIRDFLHGDSVTGLTHFAVGTGTTAVTAGDTALVTEVHRATFTSKTKSSAQLELKYYLDTATANGNTLAEAGLFNAGSGGTMYARVVLASTIVKTSSIAVTFTWTLTWSV